MREHELRSRVAIAEHRIGLFLAAKERAARGRDPRAYREAARLADVVREHLDAIALDLERAAEMEAALAPVVAQA